MKHERNMAKEKCTSIIYFHHKEMSISSTRKYIVKTHKKIYCNIQHYRHII